jgi:hypothetical protein
MNDTAAAPAAAAPAVATQPLQTLVCPACKAMTQTTVAVDACPNCGNSAEPFTGGSMKAAAASNVVGNADSTIQTPAGGSTAAPAAPAPPVAPPIASAGPSGAAAAAPPSGPDFAKIGSILMLIMQSAASVALTVFTGGAAKDVQIGAALLRIVQAAVTAYETHKGQPIDPAELSQETPV